MSSEVVCHALEAARRSALRGMKQIVMSGQDLQLVMMFIDDGGNVSMLAWTMGNRPTDAMDVVVAACRSSNAVAALFISEFNTADTDNGFRVAGMHWSYPTGGISESTFFIVDPDDLDLQEIPEHEVDIPDTLLEWLDESLQDAMQP